MFTIPKTSLPERVIENSKSVGGTWKLTDKDIEDINRVFPVLDNDNPLMI
jgi:diketogulonate reductase-like aldo/keto reductase